MIHFVELEAMVVDQMMVLREKSVKDDLNTIVCDEVYLYYQVCNGYYADYLNSDMKPLYKHHQLIS